MNGGAVAAQRQRIYLAGSCLMPHEYTYTIRQSSNRWIQRWEIATVVISWFMFCWFGFFSRVRCCFSFKFWFFLIILCILVYFFIKNYKTDWCSGVQECRVFNVDLNRVYYRVWHFFSSVELKCIFLPHTSKKCWKHTFMKQYLVRRTKN